MIVYVQYVVLLDCQNGIAMEICTEVRVLNPPGEIKKNNATILNREERGWNLCTWVVPEKFQLVLMNPWISMVCSLDFYGAHELGQ